MGDAGDNKQTHNGKGDDPENPEIERNAEGPTDSDQAEIERLNAELTEQKDRYLRSMAEMENVRRRLERERVDLVKFGLESFMKDLLPVLDSLEKAMPSDGKLDGAADDQVLNGMMMVKKQLLDVLKKQGLEPVSAAGKAFDPNLHQAIQRVESEDVETDTVKDEFARGYTLHGRLLRPAMVSVLTPAH